MVIAYFTDKMEVNEIKDQPNNPLHGVKLADIMDYLVTYYGWEELGSIINIGCFNNNPSLKSSLKFLRKTMWAREKVENLYLKTLKKHI
ncbi:MAG: hypothetical protein ACJAUV_001237 [Flavobacteriales bacterium]